MGLQGFQDGNTHGKSAGLQISLVGAQGLEAKLKALAESSIEVELATVRAGVAVFTGAARRAVKGTIRREINGWVKNKGTHVDGGAGMTKFPRRGVRYGKGNRSPHGIYLEHGTRYIAAQHAVANALKAAQSKAIAAMERAAKRKIEELSTSNSN